MKYHSCRLDKLGVRGAKQLAGEFHTAAHWTFNVPQFALYFLGDDRTATYALRITSLDACRALRAALDAFISQTEHVAKTGAI